MRPHGLDGTLRIQPLSDNPDRFTPGGSLTLAETTRTISAYQALSNGHALLRLKDLENHIPARVLAGEWIFAPIGSADALEPDEYYHYQLIGFVRHTTDEGESLGAIREILATGSNDVYVVRPESGSEILLPAISQVVKRVDLASGTMLVHLLPGLR